MIMTLIWTIFELKDGTSLNCFGEIGSRKLLASRD